MTLELGGFLALAALMIGLFAWLRTDARHIEGRLSARLDRLEQGQAGLAQGQSELRERMARLEGVIEGFTKRPDAA